MHKSISEKIEKAGNYTVAQMTPAAIAAMGPRDIKRAAAMIVLKKDLYAVQIVSVKDLSILDQALCTLPEVDVSKVSTVIRYVNKLPDGKLLISYFGAMPEKEIITALTELANTATGMNGAIFSGYATLTPAMGEEKHFSPGLAIPHGVTNIRVANRNELVFVVGKTVQKIMVKDFAADKWNTATKIDSFKDPVLFMDRIQNNVTNVVTEDKVVRGYSLLTKTAVETLAQNTKLKVLSLVQWAKTAVITTPFGLTQEPAHAHAA